MDGGTTTTWHSKHRILFKSRGVDGWREIAVTALNIADVAPISTGRTRDTDNR